MIKIPCVIGPHGISHIFFIFVRPIRVKERTDVGFREFISKIPVPICGLSLGLASLDRFLWYIYADVYVFNIFALFAFIIAGMFTLRIIFDGKGILKDIRTPAIFGVLPTYTMTLMLLSAYAADHMGGMVADLSLWIWAAAIIMSYVFMAFFIRRAFFGFKMENVMPSWIIIFVGYVVASVTSTSFGMEELGRMLFWSGLIGYLVMLPLLVYRTVIFRRIPEHLIPTIAIFAAPVNLCITGCIAAYGDDLIGMADIALSMLTVMGIVSYVLVVAYLPVMLNRKFYPSFAAMTFPLVISAVAFYRLGEHHDLLSNGIFNILQMATLMIAILVVVYVLIRYTGFLIRAARTG